MITYLNGSLESFDLIQPLFNKLCKHHIKTSTYFSEEFKDNLFDERKKKIHSRQHILVKIARENETSVGYIVASVHDNEGEIVSLYVDEGYRGCSIADTLMTDALTWIKSMKPNNIKISIAYGNQVMSFYSKYGFYPRSIILKDMNSMCG